MNEPEPFPLNRFTREFLDRMASLSSELMQLGLEAGLSRGETVRLVNAVARRHRLRGWAEVQSENDYEALIAAMKQDRDLAP